MLGISPAACKWTMKALRSKKCSCPQGAPSSAAAPRLEPLDCRLRAPSLCKELTEATCHKKDAATGHHHMQSPTKCTCPGLLQQDRVLFAQLYQDWLPLTCTIPSQRSHKGALPRDGCKEAANVLAPHPFCRSCLPILILNGLLWKIGACKSTQHCLRIGTEEVLQMGSLGHVRAFDFPLQSGPTRGPVRGPADGRGSLGHVREPSTICGPGSGTSTAKDLF